MRLDHDHDGWQLALLLALAATTLSSCNSRKVWAGNTLPGDSGALRGDGSGHHDASPNTRYYPQTIEKDVDLLVVVDNSNAMDQEQSSLSRNFPALIEGLRSVWLGGDGCSSSSLQKCRIPNLHIGIISSDLGAGAFSLPSCEVTGGDGGRLQNTPRRAGCKPPRDPWISYIDGVTNVDEPGVDPVTQVKDAFSCIAELGNGGCGFEQPLEAARRALDPALNVNPGFVRKDALLAILWITDEDDCSAKRPQLFDPSQQGLTDPLGPLSSFRCFEFGIVCDKNGRDPGPRTNCAPGLDWLYSVDDYSAFFQKLKPAGRTMLFAIAGPTKHGAEVGTEGANPVLKGSCQGAMGSGAPAFRIESLMRSFGENGHFNEGLDAKGRLIEVNICSADYSPALRFVGSSFVADGVGPGCLSGPLLTTAGGIACNAGDALGNGVTCAASCLDKADCRIEEITSMGTAQQQRKLIPRCEAALFDRTIKSCGASCPCWRIIPNKNCIYDGSPYAFQILRAGEAAQGTVAAVTCTTGPQKWGDPLYTSLPQCK